MSYIFDPFNIGAERERRVQVLSRFPALQRAMNDINKAVKGMEDRYTKGKAYAPEFLADLDAILTQADTLNRFHGEIEKEILQASAAMIQDGSIQPKDAPTRSGLGAVPLIAVLVLGSVFIVTAIGGVLIAYLGKDSLKKIEDFASGQSELNARINAAKALSDAYAEYYRKNPNGTAPSPAELLKMFPPSPGGGVTAALNLGTVVLVVGGLYLATKLVGGSKR